MQTGNPSFKVVTPVASNIPMAGYYLIVDTSPFSGGDSYHAYNSFSC